jgi:hypothetical protein
MRYFGLCSALFCLVFSITVTGCLGGDDTSVAPPPAADAGPDATTADAGEKATDSGSQTEEDSASPVDSGSGAIIDAGNGADAADASDASDAGDAGDAG